MFGSDVVSIKKIAEMTGASPSTVGRVLSNPNHKCSSEEMRERILQAARDINYVPNEAARNLKTGGSSKKEVYCINILLTRMAHEENDPFFSEVVRLVEIEIRRNSCIILNAWHRTEFSDDRFCLSEDMDAVVNEMFDESKRRSDGLIIIGKCCPKGLKALRRREKNIVSINRNSTNYEVDEVLCDGRKIAMTAIEYLVKLGHSKIGYVGDCHNETRFAGYQSAVTRFHLESDIDYIFDTTSNEEHGIKAMEYFSNLGDPPTAIYCANDILAIGMLKAMNRRGKRFYAPSVISSDDIAEAQYTKPMLTTISLPKDEMARFALMLLLDRISGGHKNISRLEMEGTLIKRESVRPLHELNEPEYYI